MSKKYGIPDIVQTTNTTTAKTMGTVVASATVRPALYDIIVGAPGTPADNAVRYLLQRFTAAGTGTAKTPNAVDSADVASIATAAVDHSIEPTYTAATALLEISVNQRASFRWVAAPDSEIRAPATAANGLGLASLSPAYTGATRATMLFQE